MKYRLSSALGLLATGRHVSITLKATKVVSAPARVSFETSFDSKLPKLVSALSETKRLFRLFRFYTETASFDVSVKPKLTETERNKPKLAENQG